MSGDFKLRSSKRLCSNQNPSYSPIKNSKYHSPRNQTDRNSKYVSKPESKQSVYKKHQSHGDSREAQSFTEHINKEVTSGSAEYSPTFLQSMPPISRNKRASSHKEVTNNIRYLRNQRYHNQLESDHQPQTKDKIKHNKSEENVQSKITDLYCTKKRPRSPKATQTLVKKGEEKTRNSSEKDKSFPFPVQPSCRQVGNISNSKVDNRKLEHSYASTKHTPVKTSKHVFAAKECDFIIRRSPRFKQLMTDEIYSSDNILLKSQTIHPPLKSTQYGLPGLFNQWSPKSKQNPAIAAAIKNTINKFNVERKSLDRKKLPTNYKSSEVKTSIKSPKGARISLEDKASLSRNCELNNVKHFTNTGKSKSDRKLLDAFDASNHCKPKTFVDTSINKLEVIIAPRRSPRIKIEHNSSLQLANNRQSTLLTSKTMQNKQLPTSHGHYLSNVIRKVSPVKQFISRQTVPSQISNQLSVKLKSPGKQNRPRQETQPTRKSPRFTDAGRSFTTGICLPTEKQTQREYTILRSHEKLSSGISDLKDRSGGTDCSKLSTTNNINSKKEITDAKSQEFSGTATDHEKQIKSPLNSRNVRRKIEFVSKQTSYNKTTAGKDDDSDDEYIPRRKKLRSEVTESELWEGFPPNIRFKRLTPKKKVNLEIVLKQNTSEYDINQTKVSIDSIIQSNQEKGNITNGGKSDTEENVGSVDNGVQEKDNTKRIESNDNQANKIDVTGMETVSEKHRKEDVSDVSNIVNKEGDNILEKLDKDIDKVYDSVSDDHIVEKLVTAEQEQAITQNSKNKVFDQKQMKVDQCSTNENKDENEMIRKQSNENILQIFDVNNTSKANSPTTTDDTSITKVDPENPNDESTVTNLDSSTKKAEMSGNASTASTPRRRKELFFNVTPKRSARLQKKIGSSKKNDVYVYTPLKRHDNVDEKKSTSDDKITNYTNDVENVKPKRKTNSVSKLDKNDLPEEPAANDIEDSKSLVKNTETENYADKVNDEKNEEATDLPCTKNIFEEEKLPQNNSDADDKLSKSINESCDEVCKQVQTIHDIENTDTINIVSVITVTRDKTLKERELNNLNNIYPSKMAKECSATPKVNNILLEETSIKNITEMTLEEDDLRTENLETSLTTKREITKDENIVDLQCAKNYDVDELKDGLTNKSNKNEHSDKVGTEMINDFDDKGCTYKEEFKQIATEITKDDWQQEPLKITMKKTKNGAAIVHRKPNNSPFVLLPRISIPGSSSTLQSNEWKGENKILLHNNNTKKDKNKGKSTKITTKKSKLSDERQLRSSEECDELRLETTPELEKTKKSGKVFKQRKRKSNEKSPLKKSKRRVSSPKKSDAMRKKVDAQCLLANKALEKHACILWSSGQRRHFQMSNPEASHTEIDDIMRKAWDQMTDKEKLGYFVRAKNAMTDEYKHSTPKKQEIPEKLPEIKECKKMLKFMSLSPSAQHEELQKWLRLFYEISAGEYSKLMLDFKEVLKQKRSELKDTYKENFKQKDAEYQSVYRKLLFRKILDVRNKIVGIYEQKIERQEIILKEAFDSTIRKLIAGEDIEFPKAERSEALSEVLLDLKDLESDLKIAVSGAPISTKSFDNVLDCLQQELDDVNSKAEDRKEAPEQPDLREPDSDFAEQLLIQSSTTELPVLDVNLVDAILNNESEGNAEYQVDDQARELFLELSKFFDREAVNAYDRLQKENDKQCCEPNNPSCLLTNWMLSDQFHALSRPINQMTRNDRMLVDSKQLVQFLKGTGPYNVVALPASTIPPNMRRAGVRRNYNNNDKITTTCSYNNNSNINSNNLNIRMLETQRSRPAMSTLPYTSRANTVQKAGIPRIVQTRIPSLPGHTLLRFTSTSNGNIRIHTSPPTH